MKLLLQQHLQSAGESAAYWILLGGRPFATHIRTHTHEKKKREGTGQWANEAGLQESIPVETGSVSCGP